MGEPSQTKGVNGLQPLVQVIRPTRRRRAETEWRGRGGSAGIDENNETDK